MARSESLFRKLLLLRAWGRGVPLRFPLTVIDVGTLVDARAEVEVRWHGPIRVVRVSIARLDNVDIAVLPELRGAVLSGFPSSLTLLAERVIRRSLALSVKLVATRGEILHDAVRDFLGRAFRCTVMDFYNCEEVGNIASQCPANPHALHVNTDGCVVEIVDELGVRQPERSPGRILVTNLYNCTMPFIRYDLQDRGAFLSVSGDRCACGSKQPTMEVVQGRDDDYLLRTDGHRVSPRLVATMLERSVDALRIDGIQDTFYRRYQIVQDAADHVTVRMIPIPHVGLCIEKSISAAFRQLDPRMHCDVVFVDDLPAEPSGKFRKVMRTFGSAGE
jgi:phenylacetate-CoA ligase